jgi:hypothetical protein
VTEILTITEGAYMLNVILILLAIWAVFHVLNRLFPNFMSSIRHHSSDDDSDYSLFGDGDSSDSGDCDSSGD